MNNHYANLVVVGGPISAGKSTLVSHLNFPPVQEIDENDKIQNLLLKLLYKKERIHNEIIELYFLQVRILRYKEHSSLLQTHVLDRSILESLWFANNTLDEQGFNHFAKLWKKEVSDLFRTHGKPRLYILLTITWETFKNRIFLRNRQVEVENFQKNIQYFQKHIQEYESYMEKIFQEFKIQYVKINVDYYSPIEVATIAEAKIREVING